MTMHIWIDRGIAILNRMCKVCFIGSTAKKSRDETTCSSWILRHMAGGKIQLVCEEGRGWCLSARKRATTFK